MVYWAQYLLGSQYIVRWTTTLDKADLLKLTNQAVCMYTLYTYGNIHATTSHAIAYTLEASPN